MKKPYLEREGGFDREPAVVRFAGSRSSPKPAARRPGIAFSPLLAGILLLATLPAYTQPVLLPANAVSAPFGDDINTSTPYSIFQMTSICPWVADGLTANGFTAANGWNVTWAPAAADMLVLADVTTTFNKAWVVNQPTYTDPNGAKWGGNLVNAEAGGCSLQLAFAPTANDPLKGQTVHWIQGFNQSFSGGPSTSFLDAPNNPVTPFYDLFSSAGQTYFRDDPGDPENENEVNPVADVQFQVFLATDNVVGTNNNVIIYGGDWWGYQYNATDVPEPSVLSMGCISLIGWIGWVVRRATRKPAAG